MQKTQRITAENSEDAARAETKHAITERYTTAKSRSARQRWYVTHEKLEINTSVHWRQRSAEMLICQYVQNITRNHIRTRHKGQSNHWPDYKSMLGPMPSVLWCCWLGGRKGIWPVKNWVVGCWRGYLSGARCRLAWSSWCHCHSLSLASVKSRLALPFWYRLTWLVPDKGLLLNMCVCVCVCVCVGPNPVLKIKRCMYFTDVSSQNVTFKN